MGPNMRSWELKLGNLPLPNNSNAILHHLCAMNLVKTKSSNWKPRFLKIEIQSVKSKFTLLDLW